MAAERAASADAELLARVRRQDPAAWQEVIANYQGRLLAFAEQRLGERTAAEDVVQETFLGFLLALPNYDARTPIEAFLFSIAAYKLTDALRRRGVRVRHTPGLSESVDPIGRERTASTLARSRERQSREEAVLADCLCPLVRSWLSRGEFERLACAELLFVRGWSNQQVAAQLGVSEQTVANHKSFVLQKLKAAAAAARLRDVDWERLAGDRTSP